MGAPPVAIRRVVSLALLSAALALAGAGSARAATTSEDVLVPGGRDVVAGMLGVRPTPEASRFMTELVRIAYDLPPGRNGEFQRRLARFKAAAPTLPPTSDVVPVPISAAFWSQAVFGHAVAPDKLFAAILTDRAAAFVCFGLAGLDDATLAYLAAHPEIVRQIYRLWPGTFAVAASALHVRDGRVEPAGGDPASALWETEVGRRVDQPEQFIPAWLALRDGHAAYLYATIDDLEPAQARFVLGEWIANPAVRQARFDDLLAAVDAGLSEWSLESLPFSKLSTDVAALLWRVRTDPSGAPAAPASRSLWSRAFSDSADADAGPGGDEPYDAAWLVRAVFRVDRQRRLARFGQFTFGQRVFSQADPPEATDVVTALRAYARYPALMLSLERAGVRAPAVYAAAARRAERINALSGPRAYAALAQYQGSLLLVSRMARSGSLRPEAGEALVRSLTAVEIGDDGWYSGGIAEWMTDTLVPQLAPAVDTESTLLAALAGAATPDGAEHDVRWEGDTYHLDLGEAERDRLTRVRHRQASEPIDVSLQLAVTARRLATTPGAPGAIGAAVDDLRHLADEVRRNPSRFIHPDGVQFPDAAATIDEAVQGLSHLAGDSPRAARLAGPLAQLGDVLLAQSLVSIAYALGIGDPDGTVLLAGDISRRHDFGFAPRDLSGWNRLAWSMPLVQVTAGTPWHVTGALLGIDVALGPLTLRRINLERPIPAPTLTLNERDSFTAGVVLLDPLTLTDAARDRIAEAIERGRARVARLEHPGPAFDRLAEELRMDGRRRRAVAWTLAHDPARADSFFSLGEFLELGGGTDPAELDALGAAGLPGDDCLCLEFVPVNQWKLRSGRPPVGLLATVVPDLNLRIELVLRELKLPAALGKDVLRSAAQDFVDEVRPTDPDDWLALVRTARAIPRERIEDYVAAAAAVGPLVPDATQ